MLQWKICSVVPAYHINSYGLNMENISHNHLSECVVLCVCIFHVYRVFPFITRKKLWLFCNSVAFQFMYPDTFYRCKTHVGNASTKNETEWDRVKTVIREWDRVRKEEIDNWKFFSLVYNFLSSGIFERFSRKCCV